MKRRGFTLIEIIFALFFVAFLAAVIVPFAISGGSATSLSVGITGVVEERCIGGYRFVVGQEGRPTQILNEFGKGVPCQ